MIDGDEGGPPRVVVMIAGCCWGVKGGEGKGAAGSGGVAVAMDAFLKDRVDGTVEEEGDNDTPPLAPPSWWGVSCWVDTTIGGGINDNAAPEDDDDTAAAIWGYFNNILSESSC